MVVVFVAGMVVVFVAGMVTRTDCGESLNTVRVLSFANPIENDDAAARVDVTATPPATAWLVDAMVHIVGEVCVIEVISEIPVKLKSTLEIVDSVVQSMASVPVTVKVIEAEFEVADDEANVAASNAPSKVVSREPLVL